MKPPPIPSDAAPEMTVVITDRAFVLAGLATLLVALGLASGMGWLAFGAMREVTVMREAFEQAKARAEECNMARNRLDAKLEQVDALLDIASGRKKAVGGP